MTGLALLLGYAALLGWSAPAVLARARWVLRAPHLAIGLWQALSISFLASLTLAGLLLASPGLAHRVSAASRLPDGPVTTAVGAILAAAIVGRTGYAGIRHLLRIRRQRRWHTTALAFTGRSAPDLGATILDQDAPAIYCLPGPRRRGRIVVTSGALRALTPAQLSAALAHERAHLACRHHLAIAGAAALARAFPQVPLLRHAHREIVVLAEMAADDVARRHHTPRALVGALVQLASAHAPAPALGAGGHTVIHRLDRILAPLPPLPLPARAAATGAAAVAPVAPLLLVCTGFAAALAALIVCV